MRMLAVPVSDSPALPLLAHPLVGLSCALALSLSAAACSRGGAGGSEGSQDAAAASDAGSSDAATADAARSDAGGGDGSADPRDLAVAPDLSEPSTDPFDPGSCAGPALTSAQALAKLGAAARLKLADATLYRRTRSCTGMTPATCGAWGAPVAHQQALLTYSGGAVTDYKTFSFPTHLMLFASAGQPRLSIRHESDYRHDATADKRGVVFSFDADPMVNTYPIIYVWDFAPKPNRYEDLQGLLGDDGFLRATERCARVVFPTGLTTEIAALYRY
jgi:hypothetical protein